MCREQRSIAILQKMEDDGCLVINSGYGIENCTRERMTRILLGSGIPYPESLIVNTDEAVTAALRDAGMTRAWIKRGDFHAMHKEDVSYVRHPEEAQEVLQEYFLRGIRRAVINRHLEGDLIKFYGVRGSSYFFWFYPFDEGHSKYGHEAINGRSKGIEFDLKELRDICSRASGSPRRSGVWRRLHREPRRRDTHHRLQRPPSFRPMPQSGSSPHSQSHSQPHQRLHRQQPAMTPTPDTAPTRRDNPSAFERMRADYRATLKSMDTEEGIDLHSTDL